MDPCTWLEESQPQDHQRSPYCIFQFCSVAQSCPTLCEPMDCNMLGFPVHHQFPELAQTHVHRVGGAIQPSHPLSSPSPPAFNLPSIRVFSNESVLRIRWPKYWSLSFSISPFNVVSLEKSKLRRSAGIRRLLFEGGSRRGLVEGEPCCRWGVGWGGVWHGALGLSKHLKRTSPSCLPPQASISPLSPGGRGHSPAAARGPLCPLGLGLRCPRPCLGAGCPRPAAGAWPGRGRASARRVQPPGSALARLRAPVTSCRAQRRPCRAAAAAAAAESKLWSFWRTLRPVPRKQRRRRGSSRAGGGRCERCLGAGRARFRGPHPLPIAGGSPRPAPFPGGTPLEWS